MKEGRGCSSGSGTSDDGDGDDGMDVEEKGQEKEVRGLERRSAGAQEGGR